MSTSLLPAAKIRLLLALTLIGHFLFISFSTMEDLGLGGAGRPEQWQLWRYLLTGGWWLLAALLFALNRQQAHRRSLISSLVFSGLAALALATFWGGISFGWGVLICALTYTLLSGLLCMTLKNHLWAALLAVIALLAQVATDILVLGAQGHFRIH